MVRGQWKFTKNGIHILGNLMLEEFPPDNCLRPVLSFCKRKHFFIHEVRLVALDCGWFCSPTPGPTGKYLAMSGYFLMAVGGVLFTRASTG